jgi:hypothetical protein
LAASLTYYDVYRSDQSTAYSVSLTSYTFNQLYMAAAVRCQQNKIRSACQTLGRCSLLALVVVG